MPELHGKLYLIKGVPDDLDIHLVKILGEMVGKIVLIIFLTCSLIQDSKKGARGVSTRTALYSSAGVLGKRGTLSGYPCLKPTWRCVWPPSAQSCPEDGTCQPGQGDVNTRLRRATELTSSEIGL